MLHPKSQNLLLLYLKSIHIQRDTLSAQSRMLIRKRLHQRSPQAIRLCIIIIGIDYIAKQSCYKELFINAIMSNRARQLLVQRDEKSSLSDKIR